VDANAPGHGFEEKVSAEQRGIVVSCDGVIVGELKVVGAASPPKPDRKDIPSSAYIPLIRL
jgi:hypothetical protein